MSFTHDPETRQFLPGPNLRVARNDTGMSLNLIGNVTDKVDPLNPGTYTEDIHTRSDGSKERVQRAKPAPLPENATLQDRLRRYSPINGYARYCAMAADKIDEQEKTIQTQRNLNFDLQHKVQALTIEVEQRLVTERNLLTSISTLNRLLTEETMARAEHFDKWMALEESLNRLRKANVFTRIFNALKGNK